MSQTGCSSGGGLRERVRGWARGVAMMVAVSAMGNLASCSTPDARSVAAQSGRAVSEPDRQVPAPDDAGTPLSEASARAILAARFREAGFRIVHDVRVQRDGAFDVTVDGYDPGARVGFEYIDRAEQDSDVTAPERASVGRDVEHQILILDASSEGEVIRAAEDFLARVRRP